LFRQWVFIKALRQERYDIVYNTTEGDRGIIFAFLTGAPRRVGYVKPKDKWWRRHLLTERKVWKREACHNVFRNLALLPPGDEPFPVSVACPWDEEDWKRVAGSLQAEGWSPEQPIVHIHPVSRWFFKCWGDERTAKVIDHIQRRLGARVVLTCGPNAKERDRLADIVAQCSIKPLNLAGKLTLKQVAALSAHAHLFVGVDTAPMHMAAAVGTPVVALFGPSGVFEWGPWPNGILSDSVPYKRRNGVQSAGRHVAIQKSWECVPCGRDGCEGSKKSHCLEELQVAEVIPYIEQRFHMSRSSVKADAP